MEVQTIVQIVVACAALLFFVWMLIPSSTRGAAGVNGDPFIDPDDSRQLGLLMGLRGGTIPDAAVMRFALKRFEQQHGRRATTRDIGIVLGLIDSL